MVVGVTRAGAWLIERRNPAAGEFIQIAGTNIHYVHVAASANADLPPVVFIHGASANLNDQMVPLRPELEDRAELLFFDRPGHGWSDRGSGNDTPDGQARTLAALMDQLGIEKAVLVAHSLAVGRGVNPFGDEALDLLPDWGERGPCVAVERAEDGA